jgi:hypothetical protein
MATAMTVSFSKIIGKEPFFYQASRSNQRRGHAGSREMYWTKDLNSRRSVDQPTVSDLRILIDVDEYISIEQMLSEQFGPLVAYTFQPKQVGYRGPEYSFWFNEDQTVSYRVNGGSTYRHAVWNYSIDVVCVTSSRIGYCVHMMYNVDRRVLHTHHELILFTPVMKFYTLEPLRTIENSPLKRLEPVQLVSHEDGNVPLACMEVYSPEGCTVSVGYAGSTHSAEISQDTHHAFLSAARYVHPKKLTTAFVQRNLLPEEPTFEAVRALVEYYWRATLDKVDQVDSGLDEYYSYNPNDDELVSLNPMVVPFQKPLYLGATVPARSVGNADRSLDARIFGLRGRAPLFTVRKEKHISEFVELVAKELLGTSPHLTPLSIAEVRERQIRPSQKVIFEQGEHDGIHSKGMIECMLKAESYGQSEDSVIEYKDPRNITIYSGSDKVHYGPYIYPVMDALKKIPCYAFGKTPKGLSIDVALSATEASHAAMTDLSRQDGRTSYLMRLFEHLLLLKLYPRKCYSDLIEAFNRGFNRKVTAGHRKYYIDWDRGSGSLETAAFNFLEDLLIHYHHCRLEKMTPKDAWRLLTHKGHFGGDDGLLFDIPGDSKTFARAAEDMGHKGKYQLVLRGQPGIEFLARTWSQDIWFGCGDNIATLSRS